MNVKLMFSVLKYIPSSIRRESLNVGIAIHIPSLGLAEFHSIKSTRRLAAFDDEYDPTFFKMMMQALHFEIDFPLTSRDQFAFDAPVTNEEILQPDYLERKTAYLANEFQFEPVQVLKTNANTCQDDVQDLIKTFLYYDRPKSQRITTAEVRRLMSKQLRIEGFKQLEKSPKVYGDFSSKSLFDYRIGDYYIKAISFDYKDATTRAKELKSTLYDLNEVVHEHEVSRIKIVINDNDQLPDNEVYKSFIQRVDAIRSAKSEIEIVPLSKLTSSHFD